MSTTRSIPSLESEHFGLNNLPFGIASSASRSIPRPATRLGNDVVFLAELGSLFKDIPDLDLSSLSEPTLNSFAKLPSSVHRAFRTRLQTALQASQSNSQRDSAIPAATEPITAVTMHLPFHVGDFTDFSCSLDHVQNASEAMTGVRSAPPAFFHMPIGYAGRCCSLAISGTDITRPRGQFWSGRPGASEIVYGPTRKMDYELELGAIVGKPLARGETITAVEAQEHVFGYVLVNDWSARDVQGLEMQPLGPLNGKSSLTTVSPWVVTAQALTPFTAKSPARAAHASPAAYLRDSGEAALGIELLVEVAGKVTCRSNAAMMYWTLAQCVAHQASAGSGLRTGDLMASGTVSGTGEEQHGCLMEFMKGSEEPPRGYLEDGEEVMFMGYCGEGVGFGKCAGTLRAANT